VIVKSVGQDCVDCAGLGERVRWLGLGLREGVKSGMCGSVSVSWIDEGPAVGRADWVSSIDGRMVDCRRGDGLATVRFLTSVFLEILVNDEAVTVTGG